MELIRTRLVPPAEAGGLLARPRLLELLQEIGQRRLTVVDAPAGFGKTSLLSQWHQVLLDAGKPAGWLTADESISDPVACLAYVAAAAGRADGSLMPAVQRLIESERYLTAEAMSTAVINLLAEARRPIVLFIDDGHLWSAEVCAAVLRVVELAGPRIHFVIASRSAPQLSLARARAQGWLLELGVQELRFNRYEAAQFIREACGVELDAAHIDTLEQRTEGWVTGLKLLGLSMRQEGRPLESLVGFSGAKRLVSDFFAEEVVAALPESTQLFMMQTAVLERFCPALCQAVSGRAESRQLLNDIERSGLFLQQLDDERTWYRYHHLLAEFLRARLRERSPEAEKQLLAHASDWFECAGLMDEAIDYALRAGNAVRAAGLLEHSCLDMAYAGRIRLVAQFAQQLPPKVLAEHPNVMLTWAWLLTRNLRFEETRRLLGTVRSTLAARASRPGADAAVMRQAQIMLAHRDMTLAAAEDRIEPVEDQCRELVRQDGEDLHPYLRGTIYAHLLFALREQFKFGELDRLAAMTQGILTRSGFSFALISAQSLVGQSYFIAGRSDSALRALQQGRDEALRFGGATSGLAALPGMPLAALLYDRDEVARAQSLLDDGLAAVSELGLADQILPGVLTQARLHAMNGRFEAALRTLDDGMSVALDRGLERLRLGIVAERIKLLLRQGGLTLQAVDYARAAGLAVPSKAVLPKDRATTQDEARAIGWIRIAQAQDRLVDALGVARHWRAFCAARGAVRSTIQWNILLAQLLFLSGDQRAAQRALREAIAAAAPLRAVRIFVDEGPVIQTLLAAAHEGSFAVQNPTDTFALELHQMMSPPAAAAATAPVVEQAVAEGLFGQLNAKEQEILSLVGAGMRNREVAQRLGTTEAAIKWHLQQVFDKVGTRRRSQAVQMARQMGLVR